MRPSGPLHWLLRLACAAEFVGHGAFGIMTKAAWVPYFGVVGIPPELAWKLMPMIGTVDIMIGLVVRSEEHTSELQSHLNLVCRLLLEKKKNHKKTTKITKKTPKRIRYTK